MLVHLRGTPGTWRPGNTVNIWNILWLSRRLIICTEHLFIHSFFVHTYFDYNKLLTIVRGWQKREKEQSKSMKLHIFRSWIWMTRWCDFSECRKQFIFYFVLLHYFAHAHSPSALTFIFILCENISLFQSLCQWWWFKKWTRNEQGFVSRPFFRSSPPTEKLELGIKTFTQCLWLHPWKK